MERDWYSSAASPAATSHPDHSWYPVDGSGTGTEIRYPGVANPECCAAFEWAPDDRWILATPTNLVGNFVDQVILDPVAGTTRSLPWSSTSEPSVQRVAR